MTYIAAQMAQAYSFEIAERDYSIASTGLELANARRHINLVEVQRSALADDMVRRCRFTPG